MNLMIVSWSLKTQEFVWICLKMDPFQPIYVGENASQYLCKGDEFFLQ